ncbi:MAG: hypothetical protein R3D27_04580 [Hyphomicrobiaceae bacterium]
MHRPTPRIEIVKRENKEEKLVDFTRECLAASPDAAPAVTVLARSLSSPVVRALAKVLDETSAAPTALRVILVQTDGLDTADAPLAGHATSYRWARQARLADAHEQIVIGTSTWIGDCMRRDPSKRDAFECYSANCAQSARWAAMAFERLWSHAEPLPAGTAAVRSDAGNTAAPIAIDPVAGSLPTAEAGEPAPLASTRH